MSERIYTFPRYELAATVLGLQDKHLKLLAAELPCHVVSRGDTLHVTGDEGTVDALVRVVEELVFLAQAGGVINEQQVNLAISMVKSGKADQLHALFADTLNITVKGRTITPKTEGQKVYVDAIRRNTITFGIGPAGTGKTFLAVTLAAFSKDFTVDEYMIYQAKAFGASAVLLICAILDNVQLKAFGELAQDLGLDALVEAHDEWEVDRALNLEAKIVGVNNRNLHDFTVDMENSVRLRKMAPENTVFVSESGIKTSKDIRILYQNRVDAVLIGETLMRSPDKKAALEELNKDIV